MRINATKLRQNLYRLLDEVLKTGKPIEIERKGRILKIISKERGSKLSNLQSHDVISGDPNDLIEIEWSKDWDELKNIK